MPRWRFRQRRDAQTLAAVRGNHPAIARPHDADLIRVRDLDRYVMEDLDRTQNIERLAAFNG